MLFALVLLLDPHGYCVAKLQHDMRAVCMLMAYKHTVQAGQKAGCRLLDTCARIHIIVCVQQVSADLFHWQCQP